MDLRRQLALTAKKAFAPLIYRHRPIGLSAGKLYLYLDAIYRSNQLPGDVVEMGCNVCGTAALGRQMLERLGSPRGYLCVDTFAGFVPEQHDADVKRGNSGERSNAFAANDIELARKVLTYHRASDVRLLQADVCKLTPDQLPARVSVCLLDVDLYEPTMAGLELVYPRMDPGGFILIDDCDPASPTWRAGVAVLDFGKKHGIESRLEFGMRVIEIPARA